jgi:RNA polymerase sigma factor (TIGR02999 family)
MPDEGADAPPATPISELVAAADRGDAQANAALFARLYADLHRQAASQLRRLANPKLTLGATTVLHEFYLDLSGREAAHFPDRARFMAYAARAMRGVIIDYVRERRAHKRGAEYQLVTLSTEVAEGTPDTANELARLGDALDELACADAALAEVVDLKYFCGLSIAEIAALQGTSERTVKRAWSKARLLLRGMLVEP